MYMIQLNEYLINKTTKEKEEYRLLTPKQFVNYCFELGALYDNKDIIKQRSNYWSYRLRLPDDKSTTLRNPYRGSAIYLPYIIIEFEGEHADYFSFSTWPESLEDDNRNTFDNYSITFNLNSHIEMEDFPVSELETNKLNYPLFTEKNAKTLMNNLVKLS